jgi:hypothetical protein
MPSRCGDHAPIEASWIGTHAVPLSALPLGGEMRPRLAIVLTCRDGKIV